MREVVRPSDPAVRSAYRLARRSFAPDELLPLGHWRDSLEERRARLWTDTAWHLMVAESGERVVGLASGNYVGSVNVALVGYVAVEPSWRASGLGSRLRSRLRRAFERDARRIRGGPLAAVMGEVRADNPWLRHLERRPGVIVLDIPYRQPSLTERGADVPLVLYYEPLAGSRRSLKSRDLRRILYALWRRAYRVDRPLAAASFRRMLRAIDGHRRFRRPRAGRTPPRSR
jgi:hypothetical protein